MLRGTAVKDLETCRAVMDAAGERPADEIMAIFKRRASAVAAFSARTWPFRTRTIRRTPSPASTARRCTG
ncbi:hypothetical protein Acsp03_03160 [Actinomadura sp. NBRC 104412]|nr:hypothetical protein Acsp03_03160 [Actinomadura sp. NBRC 104412]